MGIRSSVMKLKKNSLWIVFLAVYMIVWPASASSAEFDYPLSISSALADVTVKLNGSVVYRRGNKETLTQRAVSFNALPYLAARTKTPELQHPDFRLSR